MKSIKLFLLPLALLVLVSAGPTKDFEGTFTMQIQTYDESKNLDGPMNIDATYYVKGDQMLMEMKMPDAPAPSKVLMDMKERVVYALVDMQGQKMGMKMKIPEQEEMQEMQNKSSGDMSYNMTNETKEILGYTCKKVLVETAKVDGEMYVTKDLDIDFSDFFSGMNAYSKNSMQKSANMTPELHKYMEGGLPMQVNITEKNSENWYKMEMTNIERKSIPESMFDISGYQIMDMSNMNPDNR